MGLIKLKTETTPSTPAATYGGFFFNSADKKPYAINENGEVLLLTKPNDNFVINSDMEISQRGTSFVSPSAGVITYTLDRFFYYRGSTTSCVHTITQDTDVPTFAQSGYNSKHSLKVDCTTSQASWTSGQLCILRTILEGYDYAKLRYKTVTLSFWVKATKTGVYCVSFMNGGSDRSYVAEYTVNASDTWEKKTVTVTLDQSGGTEYYDYNKGLHITWCIACATSYHTTKDTWQTGNYGATSNQVNACDNTSNNFWLAQVKLEEGIIATPFCTRGVGYEEELALCQRYYEKSFEIGTTPANNIGAGEVVLVCTVLTGIASYCSSIPFKTRKRIASSVMTYYNPTAGTAGRWHWYKADATATDIVPVVVALNENGFEPRNTTDKDRVLVEGHWTADADFN